jgi:hypothetical protein
VDAQREPRARSNEVLVETLVQQGKRYGRRRNVRRWLCGGKGYVLGGNKAEIARRGNGGTEIKGNRDRHVPIQFTLGHLTQTSRTVVVVSAGTRMAVQ